MASKKKSKKSSTKQDQVYEVEDIVDHKVEEGIDYYLVKWKGWSETHNSWVAKYNLFCPELLLKYEKRKTVTVKKRKVDFDENEKEEVQKYLNEIFQPSQTDIESVVKQTIAKSKNATENERSGSLSGTSEERAASFSREDDLEIAALSLFRKRKQLKLMETGLMMQLLKRTISERRSEQEQRLKSWESEINRVAQGLPNITVENDVDLEGPPSNFTYISECIPGEGVTIPKDPVIGCECEDCLHSDKCCGALSGSKMVYTKTGKLRVAAGTPIYECNKLCRCGPTCSNRVVQRGARRKLTIFRTSDGRGWGVKTREFIRANTFVTEYAGEIITSEEAEKRGVQYDSEGRTYLFDLDFNDADCLYTIDAAHFGNVAHFINHSCDPNLVVFAVWDNCLDINMPRLALFAQRDIERGEELTFDYASSSSSSEPGSPRPGASSTVPASGSEEKNLCRCGSEKCRKILFSPPATEDISPSQLRA